MLSNRLKLSQLVSCEIRMGCKGSEVQILSPRPTKSGIPESLCVHFCVHFRNWVISNPVWLSGGRQFLAPTGANHQTQRGLTSPGVRLLTTLLLKSGGA